MDIERIHLAGISKDAQFKARLESVAKIFEFNSVYFDSCENLSETMGNSNQITATVLSLVNIDNLQEIAGNVQVIKYCSPDTVVLLVLKSKLSTENSEFIKKSGVYLIIDESDFYETSFVEYLLSQVIRGALIPIKYHDIHPNTAVDFKVLAVMPLNQKILPVIHPGSVITTQKMEKLKKTKEIYISRDEVDKVHKYSILNRDKNVDSTIAKCRLKYLDLCRNHSELIFSLYDKSNTVTYSSGKKLLERCSQLAKELLSNLSELRDPWSIINNSTIGETGSVERSPAIAAMAGLMARNLKDVDSENTILAGLLSDIGMLTLHPSLLEKIRSNNIEALSPDELENYKKHPILSIEKCLEKKIPLDDKVKEIIMGTHERQDNSGFPEGANTKGISKESQLLQYSEFIDQKLIIKMGQKIENAQDAQTELVEKELESKKILDVALAFSLKKYLSLLKTK